MDDYKLEDIYIGCKIPIKTQIEILKEEYMNYHGDSVLWASLGSFEENLAEWNNTLVELNEAIIAIRFYLSQPNPNTQTIKEIIEQAPDLS